MNRSGLRGRPRGAGAILGLGLVLAVVGGLGVWACDTPVYRYAMYRWEPAPFDVFHFHRGELDEAGTRLRSLIEAAQRSPDKPANVALVPVDLDKDPELKLLPRLVRDTWKAQPDAPLPTDLVFAPTGVKLFAGKLDEATLQAMLSSPVREEIVRQLAVGKAGVLVLLAGPDEKANADAEKLLQDVIQEIAKGKVPLYAPPTTAPTEKGEKDEEGKEGEFPKLEIGWVKLLRKDPRERWLVDTLLATEEDLTAEKFAKAPMVFPVFGRGRALPPCVGPGVTRDNLLACVDFMTGACSCTVKEQNPGLDLLIAHDWPATAEKLAEQFGSEEGNEGHLGAAGLFPQLMIPSGAGAAKPVETAAAAGDPTVPSASAGTGPGEAPAKTPATPAATSETEKPSAEQPAHQVESKETPSAEDDPEDAPDSEAPGQEGPAAIPAGSSALTSVFVVGGGIAVALVLLFGLTFFVLRPR
jgi:hypothetical protein